jgi:hypothetical protein
VCRETRERRPSPRAVRALLCGRSNRVSAVRHCGALRTCALDAVLLARSALTQSGRLRLGAHRTLLHALWAADRPGEVHERDTQLSVSVELSFFLRAVFVLRRLCWIAHELWRLYSQCTAFVVLTLQLSLSPTLFISLSLCVYISLRLYLCLYLCLYVSLYVSMCLSMCLPSPRRFPTRSEPNATATSTSARAPESLPEAAIPSSSTPPSRRRAHVSQANALHSQSASELLELRASLSDAYAPLSDLRMCLRQLNCVWYVSSVLSRELFVRSLSDKVAAASASAAQSTSERAVRSPSSCVYSANTGRVPWTENRFTMGAALLQLLVWLVMVLRYPFLGIEQFLLLTKLHKHSAVGRSRKRTLICGFG